jgi:hypothetical protein
MKMSAGYNAVKRLARERPDWLPIVEACFEEAKETNGEFAGAWVLERARRKGIGWFPNLRLLVSYGILKHEDTVRGGRRAYYTMPDPEGTEKALRESGFLKREAGGQNCVASPQTNEHSKITLGNW